MTEIKNKITNAEYEGWYYCEGYIEGQEEYFGQAEKMIFSLQEAKNGEKLLVLMDNYSGNEFFVSDAKEFSVEFDNEEVDAFLAEVVSNEVMKKIEMENENLNFSDLKKIITEESYEEVKKIRYLFFDMVTEEEIEENKNTVFTISEEGKWTTIEAKGEKFYFANIEIDEDEELTIFWDKKENIPLMSEHYFKDLSENPLPLWIFAKESYGDEYDFDEEEEMFKMFK